MGKKSKIPNQSLPNNPKGNKILSIDIPVNEEKRAVIGITYLNLASNNYNLKHLAEVHNKQRGNKDVFKDLECFIGNVNKEKMTIQKVIEIYHSRYHLKNNDETSREIVKQLKEKGIDATDLVHLHCKANGKGKFVLHGFILDNVFEIVLLDPEHELHG
jgi:predicted transcriptional regulator YheO|nr:MAG TPA: hypothetical protein [Caudoviricetes sp.]